MPSTVNKATSTQTSTSQQWPADNLAYITACQLAGGDKPNQWQLIAGYRILIRSTMHRRVLNLPVSQHVKEYKAAKAILFPHTVKSQFKKSNI